MSEGESTEFLQKFGYRSYSGSRNGRLRRILDLIWFEGTTTWNRSTFGKVFLIIVLVVNAIGIFFSALLSSLGGNVSLSDAQIKDGLNEFVANYLVFADNPIASGTGVGGLDLSIQIGFLLIILFAISGSGLFSDDKSGNVTEVYLARVTKTEYVTGKIGSIVAYSNLFILVPLLVVSILNVQSLGLNHLKYIGYYLGIIAFSILSSLFLSLGILVFSITLEKRHYASLGFFVFYLITTLFGGSVYFLDTNNELLLLLSPSNILVLLAYICLGDFQLGLENSPDPEAPPSPLELNNGTGLEYWHVLLVVAGYFLVCSLYLWYKIQKLTTEEL